MHEIDLLVTAFSNLKLFVKGVILWEISNIFTVGFVFPLLKFHFMFDLTGIIDLETVVDLHVEHAGLD